MNSKLFGFSGQSKIKIASIKNKEKKDPAC